MKMKPVKPSIHLSRRLSECTRLEFLHFCDMNVLLTLVNKLYLLTYYNKSLLVSIVRLKTIPIRHVGV